MKSKGFVISFIILVLVYIVFLIVYHIPKNEIIEVSSINVSKSYEMKSITENNESYDIYAYYPFTKFEKLNKYVELKMTEYINNFKSKMKIKEVQKDADKCFLKITFEDMETSKYLSFVFRIEENMQNIHPENYIYTVNYDKQQDKIVDIDELTKRYPNIVIDIAKYSYKELLNNEKIKEYGTYSMLELGTKATKSNYNKFILDNNKIIIYFEQSQVAPYVLGEFIVEIPFEKIGIHSI